MTDSTSAPAPAAPAGSTSGTAWQWLRGSASQVAVFMTHRPPAALTVCGSAALFGYVSAQVAVIMWLSLGSASEGAIFVALLAIQTLISILVIAYVLAIWIQRPDLPRDAARKALSGVVKWETGWAFMAVLSSVGSFFARSRTFAWASMDTTLVSLIMIGLVVSGVGDTFANWPFSPRAKQTTEHQAFGTAAIPDIPSVQADAGELLEAQREDVSWP